MGTLLADDRKVSEYLSDPQIRDAHNLIFHGLLVLSERIDELAADSLDPNQSQRVNDN